MEEGVITVLERKPRGPAEYGVFSIPGQKLSAMEKAKSSNEKDEEMEEEVPVIERSRKKR